ncbi:MAG: hypothetical protein KGZ25_09885, partial [Planctomycetes bacterium]|nr:hypothetical protein [Planctomycetota bacterium]
WPDFDEEAARFDEIEIPVQVNGKVRDRLMAERDADEELLREKALELESIQQRIEGKDIAKVIVVPNRIVNIVVK